MRGESCPFRHETAALTNETVNLEGLGSKLLKYVKVCTYWLAGECTKPHCIFRHLEDKRGRWSPFKKCFD